MIKKINFEISSEMLGSARLKYNTFKEDGTIVIEDWTFPIGISTIEESNILFSLALHKIATDRGYEPKIMICKKNKKLHIVGMIENFVFDLESLIMINKTTAQHLHNYVWLYLSDIKAHRSWVRVIE